MSRSRGIRTLSAASARRRPLRTGQLALGESRSGPAGGQDVRKVERDAQLTLAAPADEVQDVTNEAIAVVESNRGIVESSQTSGSEDQARATLQLTIPTRALDTTLDQLSDLADVKSLSESAVDITRPFVDAKDRLAGLRAERVALINQIQAADTQDELDQLRARLDALLQTIAQAEADFDNIQRRAAQSSVTPADHLGGRERGRLVASTTRSTTPAACSPSPPGSR